MNFKHLQYSFFSNHTSCDSSQHVHTPSHDRSLAVSMLSHWTTPTQTHLHFDPNHTSVTCAPLLWCSRADEIYSQTNLLTPHHIRRANFSLHTKTFGSVSYEHMVFVSVFFVRVCVCVWRFAEGQSSSSLPQRLWGQTKKFLQEVRSQGIRPGTRQDQVRQETLLIL